MLLRTSDKPNTVSANHRLASGFPLSFLSAIQFLVQNMPEDTLDTIPLASSKRERTLVLCLDGTGK
jgi:hypothetical protein